MLEDEAVAKCKYHEICGRNGGENTEEELCILHSEDPAKSPAAFEEALDEHRQKNKYNFQGIVFPGYERYRHAEFTERVDFSGAKFIKWADFTEAQFTQGADFFKTQFCEGTCFNRARFAEWTTFSGSVFGQEGADSVAHDFVGVVFAQEASFKEAQFWGTANFLGARFSGEAIFYACEFHGKADFGSTEFTQRADFRGAQFAKVALARFRHARFQGRTLFSTKPSDGGTVQIFSGSEVDFRDVSIEPLDGFTFRDADLRKCRFQGTDLRKAEITNAKWAEIPGKTWFGIGRRSGVYDEEDPLGPHPWAHIERVYRELKQNLEDRRAYGRAGDFHYGEKEARRKNAETSWGLWFWLTLYKWVGGYGERCLPPLVCAAGLLVVSAILYLLLGLHPKNGETTLSWTSLSDWLRSSFYSFRIMTLLRPDDLAPVGYAKNVHAFESLLGPILIGLFALALRQKLKR